MTIRYVLIVILIAMVAILGAIALNGIFEAWETGQIEDPGKTRSASGLLRAGQQLPHNTGPLNGAFFFWRGIIRKQGLLVSAGVRTTGR